MCKVASFLLCLSNLDDWEECYMYEDFGSSVPASGIRRNSIHRLTSFGLEKMNAE